MTGRDARAWNRRTRSVPSTTVSLADTVLMPVAPDVAWASLQDMEAVADCIPGLVPGSVEQVDAETFRGTLRHVALGVPSTWRLEAHVGRSAADHALTIHLEGTEQRLDLRLEGDAHLTIGGGGAHSSELAYTADLTVTGRLAGAGGPIIERVVASIIERFVQRVGSAGSAAGPSPGRWSRLIARVRRWMLEHGWLDRSGERT